MFGMNPLTFYAIVFLVFTNVLTGAGWWVASMKADHQKQRAEIAEQKLQVFADQVRAEGVKAERKTAELIATAKNISVTKDAEYAKSLDRLRADYQRLRKQYASAGSGAVPAVPEAPRSIDEVPVDALPLAAECAETTLTLESLQGWVTEQSEVSRE
jgi:flagellar biosynthesis component FlhA